MATDDGAELCHECNRPKRDHSGFEEACAASYCSGFCPGAFCPECSGEHCKRHGFAPCECDTIARHTTEAIMRENIRENADRSQGGETDGQAVVLEDARGLWRSARPEEVEADIRRGGLRLRSTVWSSLLFKPTGEITTAGRRVYRAEEAAIGALHVPLSSAVTPLGWHPPRPGRAA